MSRREPLCVGIYVHHHGAGHRVRAGLMAEELRRRGAQVTLLGSEVRGDDVVVLDRDDTPPVGEDAAPGPLHWVPLRHNGLRHRMAQLSAWVDQVRPDVVVVDVSVEVATLVRLHGVPVVLVAQPGDRTDEPHQLALRLAAAVIAPWPDWAMPAEGLEVAGSALRRVGGLSRITPSAATHASHDGPTRAVILCGTEGFDDPQLPGRICAARPCWDWTVLDGRHWVDDVEALLVHADVVVAHAGQNAVADLAAAGAPAIVLPQHRPHEEQAATGRLLAEHGLATVLTDVSGVDWGAVLDQVVSDREHSAARWARWQVAGAVSRAADVVEEVGHAG